MLKELPHLLHSHRSSLTLSATAPTHDNHAIGFGNNRRCLCSSSEASRWLSHCEWLLARRERALRTLLHEISSCAPSPTLSRAHKGSDNRSHTSVLSRKTFA